MLLASIVDSQVRLWFWDNYQFRHQGGEHIQEEEEGYQYHVGALETDDESTESSGNTGMELEATQGLGRHTPLQTH